MGSLWAAAGRYYRRKSGSVLFRRPLTIRCEQPLISFTFDDYPRSALLNGGTILNARGFKGTYYVALGLLGTDSPSGKIIDANDLRMTLDQGHELGCHTYSHNDSWDTDSTVFEESILRNREELQKLIPGARFKSFSYPRSSPRPAIKRAAARHFQSCRGGAQRSNIGTADLNQLSAYFLEKCNGDIARVRQLIEMNHEARGWLILATHDVTRDHGPYGCTPEFFEEVVEYSRKSGARILPAAETLEAIRGS
jgi:peptidoglycan/xylan/chitin deacetylase (PgdA/CDA1 family)